MFGRLHKMVLARAKYKDKLGQNSGQLVEEVAEHIQASKDYLLE